MFMKTMAVGPLELVASWVTGGTVARVLCDVCWVRCQSEEAGVAVNLEM